MGFFSSKNSWTEQAKHTQERRWTVRRDQQELV